MGFNCPKAIEPLQRDGLFFTTKSLEISGTQKEERLSRPWGDLVDNLYNSKKLTFVRPFVRPFVSINKSSLLSELTLDLTKGKFD